MSTTWGPETREIVFPLAEAATDNERRGSSCSMKFHGFHKDLMDHIWINKNKNFAWLKGEKRHVGNIHKFKGAYYLITKFPVSFGWIDYE